MSLRGFITAVVLAVVAAGCSCGPGPGECAGGSTRPCPLTLGVCAAAVSSCTSGHWSTCDYGPDFEPTERRCDGLDNDCDGRVDRSATHVLRANDVDSGRLFAVDAPYRLIGISDGFLLVTPDENQNIAASLEPQGRVLFPGPRPFWSIVLPAGDGWFRISRHREADHTACYVEGHQIFPDGGFDLAPDGGLVNAQRVDLPSCSYTGSLAAIPIDGGWAVAATSFTDLSGVPMVRTLSLIHFWPDGGASAWTFDAGVTHPGTINDLGVVAGRGGFEIWDERDIQKGPTWLGWLPSDGTPPAFTTQVPGAQCAPRALRDRGWNCSRYQALPVANSYSWLTTSYAADGAVSVPEFEGGGIWSEVPMEALFVRTSDSAHASTETNDAGRVITETPWALAIVRDGGIVPLAQFRGWRDGLNLLITEVSPGLVLLTRLGPTGGQMPPQGADLLGEYLCVPP